MPASETKSTPWPAIAIGAVLALTAGGALWWLSTAPPDRSDKVTLTPEARGYVRSLALSDVEMKATESYLKQSIVEISGNIANKGDRVLKLVEINCVFHDPYGQLVLRDRKAIAGGKFGLLRPGETRTFRLAFDNIPESWNQSMPQLVIAQIQFE